MDTTDWAADDRAPARRARRGHGRVRHDPARSSCSSRSASSSSGSRSTPARASRRRPAPAAAPRPSSAPILSSSSTPRSRRRTRSTSAPTASRVTPIICVSKFVAGGDPCTGSVLDADSRRPLRRRAATRRGPSTYPACEPASIPAGNDNWPVAQRNFGCPTRAAQRHLRPRDRAGADPARPSRARSLQQFFGNNDVADDHVGLRLPARAGTDEPMHARRETAARTRRLRRTRRRARLARDHAGAAARRHRVRHRRRVLARDEEPRATRRRRRRARRRRHVPGRCRAVQRCTRRVLRTTTATPSARSARSPRTAAARCSATHDACAPAPATSRTSTR